MSGRWIRWIAALALAAWMGEAALAQGDFRRLPVKEYRDKMKAGWLGQMAGVGWGGPTEFRWRGEIIPADAMPEWTPETINQFHQDDIYVEMTFLRSMELHGLDVSIRQAGIDFANSGYPLWHANRYGRENLRNGIAPPDSGHPAFNSHADDIDYQIEADFSGLIAPGLPNVAIQMGEVFGRLMNYGDGVYGGQFVGGMYAEAFFESDPEALVRAGLACIPEESQYAEAIRDTLAWWRETPDDWEAAWEKINQKYHLNPEYRRFSCTGPDDPFNIDAKINGAYIAMGLLYGGGDFDKTIVISTRCGQDSDCNPANAAGVLFTAVGASNLPERFTSALDTDEKFSHTEYNFTRLIEVCEDLARQAVLKAGGRIETDGNGDEVFVIPLNAPEPGPLVSCHDPGPVANSRFTDEEMAQITALSMKAELEKKMNEAAASAVPGWTVNQCGTDMDPGLLENWNGRSNVLLTHPLNEETPCVLSKTVDIPADKKTRLRIVAGHHPEGDWTLVAKADGEEIYSTLVGMTNGWLGISIDLTRFAGKTVNLELLNKANGWRYEAGYWAEIELESL